mmetsp:Transcript_66085/g.184038  ORF Transcript_66085/g.184038 Transcript_66085/m.184038 type:complete len:634 (-) Transcript_66085:122-2023(-)
MEKMYEKYYGKLKHEAVKMKRQAKKTLELETTLEQNLREATSNQNWGCPTTVLFELSCAANNYHDRQKIMATIWEKLDRKPDKWRRIIKSLTLLEYLVKNGPEQVVGEVQGEQLKVRDLLGFQAKEEGQDRGAGVREKAQQIIDLVADKDLLRSEREKAHDYRVKFHSASASPTAGHSGSGGGGGGSGGGGNALVNSLGGAIGGALASSGLISENGISRSSFEERFNELKKKRDEDRKDSDSKALKFEPNERKERNDDDDDRARGRDGNRDRDRDWDRDRNRDRDRDRGRNRSDSEERGRGNNSDARRTAKDSKRTDRDEPDSGYTIFDGSGRRSASKSDSDQESCGKKGGAPMQEVDLLDMMDNPAAPTPVLAAPPATLAPPPAAAEWASFSVPAPPPPARGGAGFGDFLGESPSQPQPPASASGACAGADDFFADADFQSAQPAVATAPPLMEQGAGDLFGNAAFQSAQSAHSMAPPLIPQGLQAQPPVFAGAAPALPVMQPPFEVAQAGFPTFQGGPFGSPTIQQSASLPSMQPSMPLVLPNMAVAAPVVATPAPSPAAPERAPAPLAQQSAMFEDIPDKLCNLTLENTGSKATKTNGRDAQLPISGKAVPPPEPSEVDVGNPFDFALGR